MRLVGIDFGERRIGLAVSDASGTLARPLRTIERDRSDELAADALASVIDDLNAQANIDAEPAVSSIVVGLPTRLDGSASDQTVRAQKMAALLASRTAIPVVFQDERLSSHEAGERLALKERDWRKRKEKLDAAAAAVILQDYLDRHQ
jgi:putative Holliday junction resolvase